LDGVRAYWNGKKMISRNGKEINCPNWFTKQLPEDTALDGELWLGRKMFEVLVGVLNFGLENPLWKDVKYIVYDLPQSKKQYESRIDCLRSLRFLTNVQIINVQQCLGNNHLLDLLAKIMDGGGEGLMANAPYSYYAAGQRTSLMLKVKVTVILCLSFFSGMKIVKCNFWRYFQLASIAYSNLFCLLIQHVGLTVWSVLLDVFNKFLPMLLHLDL
jgi:ATP-dependent DNA ligase